MDAKRPNEPSPGTLRADVWLALWNAPEGLTDDELDAKLTTGKSPIAPKVWRERREELAKEGAVHMRGQRDGKTVWHCRRRNNPAPEAPVTAPPPPAAPPPPPAVEVDDNRPTVLLIDGKNLLYRSLMTRGGEPVEQDFPKRLRELRDRYSPAFAIVTWDADGPTWRHNAYADYKAQRGEPSPYERQVYAQVPGWASMCGYQFVEAPGWEADDIIGTYAKRMRDSHRVVIVSNDKDLTQLLVPGVIMLKGWAEVIRAQDVHGLWGVQPQYIPDLLAIMGDSSDNIPGIPKVGEKGAAKLINEFGDIEAIIAAAKAGKDKAKARAARVIDFADALRLYKQLTTVSCGIANLAAPVPCSAMVPAPQGKRVALDGMVVLDGALYPLPETAHMAMQLGWTWTNPSKASDRNDAQLRPGEPMERWERQDHWGYLVERGGQWTFVHRGIEGDIETGLADLGSAIAEARVYHAAYCALCQSSGPPPAAVWAAHPPSPVVEPAALAVVLPLARKATDEQHAALVANTTPDALRAQRAANVASPPPPASAPNVAHPQALVATVIEGGGLLPTGVSYTIHSEQNGVIGSVELPAGSFGQLDPITLGVEVQGIASPVSPPSAPMVARGHSASLDDHDTSAPYDIIDPGATVALAAPPPPEPPKSPPWAIPPSSDGKATIPFGYARVLAALALDAFAGDRVRLCWALDLKTDIETPPLDTPGAVTEFREQRCRDLLGRLRGAVSMHATDPGATRPLGVIVRDDPNGSEPVVLLDLPSPCNVNIARIANGPPPAGRWEFMTDTAYADPDDGVPRGTAHYFDPVPF